MKSRYNYTSDCHIDILKSIIMKLVDFFDNDRTENKEHALYFMYTIKIT